MALGWKMDAIVRGHRAVMDRYDPEAKAALVVDEWGSWYAPEPGASLCTTRRRAFWRAA